MANWLIEIDIGSESLFYDIHFILFFRMLANIIFAVCFVVYGVYGKPPSKGNVNNSELSKLDNIFCISVIIIYFLCQI